MASPRRSVTETEKEKEPSPPKTATGIQVFKASVGDDEEPKANLVESVFD